MKKVIIPLLIFIFSSNINAALNGLSVHSRANCINNESISWDWTHNWNLKTEARHYLNHNFVHMSETEWENTWRSAAVHWGEGRGGWSVSSDHYIAYKDGDNVPLGSTYATDCSIYNGWWEKNK